MNRVKNFFVFFAFSFSLVACSQKPVFTMEVLDKTPTLAPSPIEPISTATPPPLDALTPTAAMSSDFSPILYGKKYDANTFFILLGGWNRDGWLAPDVAATYFGSFESGEYDAYTMTKGKSQVHGHRLEFSPAHKIYTVGTDVTVDEPGMVAVAHGWSVLQRDVQELSPDNEMYRQAVLDWLTEQGLSAPEINTLRVFRVDLEGDGVNEIFISATHLEDQHLTKPGDYSIVLMRRVHGNDVVTLPVVGDIYRSEAMTLPPAYSLGNFLDLNQDGVLEVVIDIRRWDGDGAVIYQIDGQKIAPVP